jgi:hypothetical protein
VVVEGVAEAAEAFGEDAQLTLQVGAGVIVPAAALRPVEFGEERGPVSVCAEVIGESGGDEWIEVLTEF